MHQLPLAAEDGKLHRLPHAHGVTAAAAAIHESLDRSLSQRREIETAALTCGTHDIRHMSRRAPYTSPKRQARGLCEPGIQPTLQSIQPVLLANFSKALQFLAQAFVHFASSLAAFQSFS